MSSVLFLFLALSACATAQSHPIDRIIMDFPHGERRISVERSGRTLLTYGALPRFQTVRPGIFTVDGFYETIAPHLHPNVPREQRPDPKAEYGMVTIRRSSGEEKSYLIYDLQKITDPIFEQAEKNVIGDLLK